MIKNNIQDSFLHLKKYCESENFKGWDPYDGLNSKVYQSLPLIKNSAFFRLLIIQLFKRSPINLRKLAIVPKGHNAKAVALFLQGYCNLFNLVKSKPKLASLFGTLEELRNQISELAKLLISSQSHGYSGSCWGYNFDWQSKAFFLPKYTPTVVATSFAVESLLSAYVITKDDKYLSVACSSGKFILNDLNRIERPKGYMFSYSPLDNRAVYNASLLGTKTLSLIYHYTKNETFKEAAFNSALAVSCEQNKDGSFPHSDQVGNKWRDSFHTGFKLESLMYYQRYCSDKTFNDVIITGYRYWVSNFFDRSTGVSYYYDTHTNLIDLHCVAQAISTFYKLNKMSEEQVLQKKILIWAIDKMQSKEKGFFYFQIKNGIKNKCEYMRWPNAWMFYGMSYWLLNEYTNEQNT